MARRLLAIVAVAAMLALPGVARAATPDEIVAALDSYWAGQFAALGLPYSSPNVQAVTGPTSSPCGELDTWIAPGAYCAGNDTVYYVPSDTAGTGESAVVLAHEFGHHIEHLLGGPAYSLDAELTADCLGGAFMKAAVNEGLVSPGSFALGLQLTQRAGDSFTSSDGQVPHGPGNFRSVTFLDGYNGGPAACGV